MIFKIMANSLVLKGRGREALDFSRRTPTSEGSQILRVAGMTKFRRAGNLKIKPRESSIT